MGHVLAILDQDTFKAYATEADAPTGSIVFRSSDDLARMMSTQTMDTIRGKLFGFKVESSTTKDAAAVRLWHAMSVGIDVVPRVDWSSRGYVRTKDGFGNNKIADTSEIELLQLTWAPGRDYMVDFFLKKMPKQARQCIDMLRDDGGVVWTNAQADAIIQARESEIITKMSAVVVFRYYKGQYFQKKVMRRLTYAEFLERPEFSGVIPGIKEQTAS